MNRNRWTSPNVEELSDSFLLSFDPEARVQQFASLSLFENRAANSPNVNSNKPVRRFSAKLSHLLLLQQPAVAKDDGWVGRVNHRLASRPTGRRLGTPDWAVWARCPRTRLSVGPCRSAAPAAGPGGAAGTATGSALRSEWTRRRPDPPGSGVGKHCRERKQGARERNQWSASTKYNFGYNKNTLCASCSCTFTFITFKKCKITTYSVT